MCCRFLNRPIKVFPLISKKLVDTTNQGVRIYWKCDHIFQMKKTWKVKEQRVFSFELIWHLQILREATTTTLLKCTLHKCQRGNDGGQSKQVHGQRVQWLKWIKLDPMLILARKRKKKGAKAQAALTLRLTCSRYVKTRVWNHTSRKIRMWWVNSPKLQWTCRTSITVKGRNFLEFLNT